MLVYKVDRSTRSLADFAKLVELFDAHGVSFVSAHPGILEHDRLDNANIGLHLNQMRWYPRYLRSRSDPVYFQTGPS